MSHQPPQNPNWSPPPLLGEPPEETADAEPTTEPAAADPAPQPPVASQPGPPANEQNPGQPPYAQNPGQPANPPNPGPPPFVPNSGRPPYAQNPGQPPFAPNPGPPAFAPNPGQPALAPNPGPPALAPNPGPPAYDQNPGQQNFPPGPTGPQQPPPYPQGDQVTAYLRGQQAPNPTWGPAQGGPPQPGVGQGVGPGPAPMQEPPLNTRGARHRAADLLQTESLGQTSPAKLGWRALANRLGLKVAPGKEELELRRDLAAILQPFSRPMTVMVANPKGGAGKTPISLMLAGGFGQTRGGGVVAWDNNELRGNMGSMRAASQGKQATVVELLAGIEMLERPDARLGDLARYLRHQPDGQFEVLAAQSVAESVVGAEDFERIHAILTRFLQIVVIDTGNNELATNWQAAAATADQLVVPVKWAKPSAFAAVQMLEQLQHSGFSDLVTSAVVVATNGPADAVPAVRTQYLQYFKEHGHVVVEIPTDTHVHASTVIEHDALAAKTRRAAIHLAAEVSAGFARADLLEPRKKA